MVLSGHMDNFSSVSELVNAISENTLKEEVGMLRRKIQRKDIPSFMMGYCASDTPTFERVVEYIQEQVAPQAQQPLEITLEPKLTNLKDYFLLHKEELQSATGDIFLVKARNFESLRVLELYKHAFRAAHDYDQDVCEDAKSKFKGLNKKVLVITHIDPSKGKELYERAVRSAVTSQFKSFLYEFR